MMAWEDAFRPAPPNATGFKMWNFGVTNNNTRDTMSGCCGPFSQMHLSSHRMTHAVPDMMSGCRSHLLNPLIESSMTECHATLAQL